MTKEEKQDGANTEAISWLRTGQEKTELKIDKLDSKVDKNHEAVLDKLDKQSEKSLERDENHKKEYNKMKWLIVANMVGGLGTFVLTTEETKQILLSFINLFV